MAPEEVAALLNHAATFDERLDRVLSGDAQAMAKLIGAWVEALRNVPPMAERVHWDASIAVRRYYEQHGDDRSARYHPIQPRDILSAWGKYRSESLDRHIDPEPTTDPDDWNAYLTELRAARTAVATGRATPARGRKQLEGAKRIAYASPAHVEAMSAKMRRDIALVRAGAQTSR